MVTPTDEASVETTETTEEASVIAEALVDETPIVEAEVAPLVLEEAPIQLPLEPPMSVTPAVPTEMESLRGQFNESQNLIQEQQNYIEHSRQQAAEAQRQGAIRQQETDLINRGVQYRTSLEASGVMPEQASHQANTWYTDQGTILNLQGQVAEVTQKANQFIERTLIEDESKRLTARQLARGNSVLEADLMRWRTPGEMELAAELFTLKNNQSRLLKAEAPPSQNDDGRGIGGAMNGSALEIAVGSGDIAMTPDIQRRLNEHYKRQGFGG
jgi:hypothetical protein